MKVTTFILYLNTILKIWLISTVLLFQQSDSLAVSNIHGESKRLHWQVDFAPVFRIWIRKIQGLLGLPDTEPDPSISKQKIGKP